MAPGMVSQNSEPLIGSQKYVDLCFAHYSLLTYIYTLHDNYRKLHSYIEKADILYRRFRSWSYNDSIHLSGFLVTYLEIFVALRLSIKSLFYGDTRPKYKIAPYFEEQDFIELYENSKKNLPVIDDYFWVLRNEISHGRLKPILPRDFTLHGGGREKPEDFSGLYLPTYASDKLTEENKARFDEFKGKNSSFGNYKYVRLIDSVQIHYQAIIEFHDSILRILSDYSIMKFGRSLEMPFNGMAMITKEENQASFF